MTYTDSKFRVNPVFLMNVNTVFHIILVKQMLNAIKSPIFLLILISFSGNLIIDDIYILIN